MGQNRHAEKQPPGHVKYIKKLIYTWHESAKNFVSNQMLVLTDPRNASDGM